jgi:hypothetical protein
VGVRREAMARADVANRVKRTMMNIGLEMEKKAIKFG